MLFVAIVITTGCLLFPGLRSALETRRIHFEMFEAAQWRDHFDQVFRRTTLSSIEFQERPLEECLEEIFESLKTLDPTGKWSFEIAEDSGEKTTRRKRVIPPLESGESSITEVDPSTPVTLELKSVSPYEALLNVCALAEARPEWNNQHVTIQPHGYGNWTKQSQERMEFDPPTFVPGGPYHGPGPVDLRHELQRSFAVEFYEGDRLEYFPNEGRIVAEAGRETLDWVESILFSGCLLPNEPKPWDAMKERTTVMWLSLLEKLEPMPPLSSSLNPSGSEPVDPFATSIPSRTSPTQDSENPDPFGQP